MAKNDYHIPMRLLSYAKPGLRETQNKTKQNIIISFKLRLNTIRTIW